MCYVIIQIGPAGTVVETKSTRFFPALPFRLFSIRLVRRTRLLSDNRFIQHLPAARRDIHSLIVDRCTYFLCAIIIPALERYRNASSLSARLIFNIKTGTSRAFNDRHLRENNDLWVLTPFGVAKSWDLLYCRIFDRLCPSCTMM